MPAYNAEAFIEDSIRSVTNQTYQHWELIVVNDGSTDSTDKIVVELGHKDKRILYTYQQNGRQGKARNRGIKMARGKYLAFLDADDIWTPEKLEKQIKQIELEEVDLVFSNYGMIDEKGNVVNQSIGIKDETHFGISGLELFLEQNRIPILTVLAKKTAVERCGLFSEIPLVQNAEDYHLWLKMLIGNCRFTSFNHVFAYYRVHAEQNTKADSLATGAALNALISLKIEDASIAALHQKAIYKWLFRYFRIYSQSSGHVKAVYKYLSNQSIQFKLLNNLLPIISARWERRLVLKFCHLKLSQSNA